MRKILLAWLGFHDLRAMRGETDAGDLGPIGQALTEREFVEAVLLVGGKQVTPDAGLYLDWLKKHLAGKSKLSLRKTSLKNPTNYAEIYEATHRLCEELAKEKPEARLVFHLSPGTPAMSAVWLLLAKASFDADLIQTSREAGLEDVEVPFDISAEYVPKLSAEREARYSDFVSGRVPENASFATIIGESKEILAAMNVAQKFSKTNLPVLIEGESGTGKELFANAIHQASGCTGKFVEVNCGAFAKDLLQSELFGHARGAFSGAVASREGHFEVADGGTLFLDEIGEMPKELQPNLLRVLQEGKVTRLGESKTRKVDVRVVAATNRVLYEEVALGNFRADLYFRLAGAIVSLPPVRERKGDLGKIIDYVLKTVNDQLGGSEGLGHKKLGAAAKKRLLQHRWPGNVREILNTVTRAYYLADGSTIQAADVERSILRIPRSAGGEQILDRPLGDGFSVNETILEVERHYLERALKEAGSVKARAAKLIGLKNATTFTNWMERHHLETKR